MTIDFSATPDDDPTNKTGDGPTFAPVPAWERNRKRRGFGMGRRDAEPRSFAPGDEPLTTDPMADSLDPVESPVESDDGTFAAGPTFANRTRKTASSNVPIAIVAALIVIGGVGAAGWYALQPHGAPGVAELTPGSTSTTTTPDGSVTTQVAETATPPATPAAPAEKSTTTTTTAKTAHGATVTHKTTTTVRSRAASDTAADASTTAPMPAPAQAAPAPAPTSAAPPAAAPVPNAPLHLTLPPSPAAPTTTSSADTPAPVQSAPPPTQTPPTQTPPTA
jgi:hypothetical protein